MNKNSSSHGKTKFRFWMIDKFATITITITKNISMNQLTLDTNPIWIQIPISKFLFKVSRSICISLITCVRNFSFNIQLFEISYSTRFKKIFLSFFHSSIIRPVLVRLALTSRRQRKTATNQNSLWRKQTKLCSQMYDRCRIISIPRTKAAQIWLMIDTSVWESFGLRDASWLRTRRVRLAPSAVQTLRIMSWKYSLHLECPTDVWTFGDWQRYFHTWWLSTTTLGPLRVQSRWKKTRCCQFICFFNKNWPNTRKHWVSSVTY